MPLEFRFSAGKSRAFVAPVEKIIASNLDCNSFVEISRPMSILVINSMPSFLNSSTLRLTTSFPSFILGIPYIKSPPIRSFRS